MKATGITKEIKKRIEAAPYGTIFVAADFVNIAPRTHVGVLLSRIEKEGLVRRVMRGVYEKPLYNQFLQEYVAPAPDAIAHALARNFGWTIIPCGDTALNLLGLSTQVSAVWCYMSDGVYKKYTYLNNEIEFKHRANKEISKLSYKSALVVQAFKALGRDHVYDATLEKLKNELSQKEKQNLLHECKTTTSWVYELIKKVCEEVPQ